MSRRREKRERPDFGRLRAFAVECPGCRQHVAVATTLAGRVVRCPACGAAFLVPSPEPEEPRLPDPSARRSRGRRQPAAPLPAVEPFPAASVPEPMAAPRPEPKVPAVNEPVVFAEPKVATPRPEPRVPTVDEPIVFTEPPPPSTRGLLHEAPPATAATDTAANGEPPAATSAQPEGEALAAGLAFRDPVRTVRSGGAEIELRRLTPEEKRVRRTRRNLIILVIGAALLVALCVILGGGGR